MKKKVMPSLGILYCVILCVAVILTFVGSRVITVLSENAPPNPSHCIIIDAGHGGVDGGATSCSGVLESEINLQFALRLNDLLHLLGMKTIMIRTTDISVYTEGSSIAAKKVSDLKNRVNITNTVENGILISLHQNHFSDSRYRGAQVFYAHTPGSEALAKSMQSQLIKSLNPGSNRQAKKASGVYLLQNIQCPGVLIECGFLSNPEEDAKLRNPDYQRKMCCVIASAISMYLRDDLLA